MLGCLSVAILDRSTIGLRSQTWSPGQPARPRRCRRDPATAGAGRGTAGGDRDGVGEQLRELSRQQRQVVGALVNQARRLASRWSSRGSRSSSPGATRGGCSASLSALPVGRCALVAARPVIRVSSRHRPLPALLPLLSLPGRRRPSDLSPEMCSRLVGGSAAPPSLVEVLEYVLNPPLAGGAGRPGDDVGFA